MDARQIKPVVGTIACCLCGVQVPSTTTMCKQCLRGEVDVTQGVARSASLLQCKTCERYQSANERWLFAPLESAELLTLCLKRIDGLGRGKATSGANKAGVRLVDAKWIWTEPHSRRLKIQMVLEQEVLNGALVRQSMVTEFVVRTQMCPFCARELTDQHWSTVVQVRQKVDHKRTMLFLEQLILSHSAHAGAIKMDLVNKGMDFFYIDKNVAVKLADFIQQMVPARRRESKELKGTDIRNNKSTFRFTISIEIVPICKFDLMILPRKLQNQLFGGSKSPLVLCSRVARSLHLVDPQLGTVGELRESKFWNNQFRPLFSATSLVELIVLDIEEDEAWRSDVSQGKGDGSAFRIVDAEVALASDFGVNDRRFLVKTHLGGIIHPGDTVLGYDLHHANLAEEDTAVLKGGVDSLPPVVLVKKKPEPKAKKSKKNRTRRRPDKTTTVNDLSEATTTGATARGAGQLGANKNQMLDNFMAADIFNLSEQDVMLTMEEFEGELDDDESGDEAIEEDEEATKELSAESVASQIANVHLGGEDVTEGTGSNTSNMLSTVENVVDTANAVEIAAQDTTS